MPTSLTHFPSLDRPVTDGTFNQRSTIATTLFVNLTNTGNSQQRTNPILYEKYNLKIKSTKMYIVASLNGIAPSYLYSLPLPWGIVGRWSNKLPENTPGLAGLVSLGCRIFVKYRYVNTTTT